MKQRQLGQDTNKLGQSLLPVLPEAMINPAFVIVSGLPGTGKSFFCRRLAERTSFCILESDVVRKALFPFPCYSAEESAHLFSICHNFIEELLHEGIPLIFDATNLSERNRERLYRISDKTGAKLILVCVEAPAEVVYQRMKARKSGMDPDNRSDADYEVYRQMQPTVDRIQRNHLVVDTSRDIMPVIDKIMRMINH